MLASQTPDALPVLTQLCAEQTPYGVHAEVMLAEIYESHRDIPAACQAYRRIIANPAASVETRTAATYRLEVLTSGRSVLS